MQVTGNNNSPVESLSILIYRGGLSFYDSTCNCLKKKDFPEHQRLSEQVIEGVEALVPEGTDSIKVIMAASRYIMIPEELFDVSQNELYLQARSIPYDKECDTIVLSVYNGVVFIMVLETEMVDFLKNRFKKVSYIHPLLLSMIHYNKFRKDIYRPVLFVDHLEGQASVALFDKGNMLFGELLTADNNCDILFYVKTVLENYGITDAVIVAMGNHAENLYILLRDYYNLLDTMPLNEYYVF